MEAFDEAGDIGISSRWDASRTLITQIQSGCVSVASKANNLQKFGTNVQFETDFESVKAIWVECRWATARLESRSPSGGAPEVQLRAIATEVDWPRSQTRRTCEAALQRSRLFS